MEYKVRHCNGWIRFLATEHNLQSYKWNRFGRQTLEIRSTSGKHSGPLLIIIYINDIPQVSKIVKFIFNADLKPKLL